MNVLSGKGLGLSVLSSVLFALMPVYFAWLAPLPLAPTRPAR